MDFAERLLPVIEARLHRPFDEHKAAWQDFFGHLFVESVRDEKGTEGLADDPLLRLYEEGAAQYCEHIIFGRETWRCASQAG